MYRALDRRLALLSLVKAARRSSRRWLQWSAGPVLACAGAAGGAAAADFAPSGSPTSLVGICRQELAADTESLLDGFRTFAFASVLAGRLLFVGGDGEGSGRGRDVAAALVDKDAAVAKCCTIRTTAKPSRAACSRSLASSQ